METKFVIGDWLGNYDLNPRYLIGWGALCLLELLTLVVYLGMSRGQITNPLVFIYPFVWVNVGIWAIGQTSTPSTGAKRRFVARLIGGGYFLGLAFFGGVLAFGGSEALSITSYWTLPPGYGPLVVISSPLFRLVLEPYKLVGYFALAYLVYAAILDTFGKAARGILGVFSCVSCTWPILGTFLSSLFGSTSVVVTAASTQPYGASTVVFLSAVALLTWRPNR